MGVLEGSLSFKTYHVEGEPPNDFHEKYLKMLGDNAFQELSPVSDDERHIGWTNVRHPLDVSFERESVFYTQYILFALRVDKWVIPSVLLKEMSKKAVRERLGDDNATPSKKVREEVKEEITLALKQKLLPSMKIVDVAWNFRERKCYFWSNAKSLCDEFEELFEHTFGMALKADSAYVMAEKLGLPESTLQAMLQADIWLPNMEN